MTISELRVSFRIADHIKTSRLVFVAYPTDRRLCIVNSIVSYLERTYALRGPFTGFFLTMKPPIRVASQDTLHRWTKDIMRSAGIDLNIIFPHSTRSASTSKAVLKLPLATIISTVGWSRESTFTSSTSTINKAHTINKALIAQLPHQQDIAKQLPGKALQQTLGPDLDIHTGG
ncbi:hypothetical protein E2C01_041976 [Portunus trituberculatus]|uniref:Tyr recombinase domain-containing protein n=1 Tax=Portunus trituberculatus TaxID=210409 RepID=A0A5B7FTB5_PORTR|nr:hypothetical protein [Portunus trituberculatus]